MYNYYKAFSLLVKKKNLVRLMSGTFALSIDGDLFRADITLPRA